ncbi:6-phosphogluconolactonase [Longispora albida]|uniref:6-phosphogluconolactonase n=1 Tax=Longispora albida TaxID=203523 RepID=UPI0003602F90|nr:6-phosphogluconolactonase [Longispora albida]
MTTSVVVHGDQGILAQAVAARLITRIIDAQAERGSAEVVLTGGRVAAAVYAAVRDSPAREAIDWGRVGIWWGDERFLPAGDPERNETQAREVLLDLLPLDPARVHAMPAADGPDGGDPEAAAARYAAELAEAAGPGHQELPHFDVLLLGVGEDGHVASVFPGLPAVHDRRPVVAVRGAPKPPSTRISLTLPAINTAEDVWLIAAGTGKAAAVDMAVRGAGPVQVPAAGVTATGRTLWLLDREAAAALEPRYRSLHA